MSNEWRDTCLDPPWWDDDLGSIELLAADGSIVRAAGFIDALFNGDDEVPVPRVKSVDSGEEISFALFEKWRVIQSAG